MLHLLLKLRSLLLTNECNGPLLQGGRERVVPCEAYSEAVANSEDSVTGGSG